MTMKFGFAVERLSFPEATVHEAKSRIIKSEMNFRFMNIVESVINQVSYLPCSCVENHFLGLSETGHGLAPTRSAHASYLVINSRVSSGLAFARSVASTRSASMS